MVTKKDGGIRICADFKVTVNPHLYIQTNPLPTPDEVFSKLESFTKLDLARAYKQMKAAADSQKYLTINTHMGLYRYLAQAAIWHSFSSSYLAKGNGYCTSGVQRSSLLFG